MKFSTLLIANIVLAIPAYGTDKENKERRNQISRAQSSTKHNTVRRTGWYDLPPELQLKIFNYVSESKFDRIFFLKKMVLLDKSHQEFIENMSKKLSFNLFPTSKVKKVRGKNVRGILVRHPNLMHLRLPKRIELSPKTLKTLLTLKSLVSLDFSFRSELHYITKLTQLTSLNLKRGDLKDSYFSHLSGLTRLTALNLSHIEHAWSTWDEYGNVTAEGRDRLTDKGISYLNPLTELIYLNLVGAELTKKSIPILMRCKTVIVSPPMLFRLGGESLTKDFQKAGIELIVRKH